MAKLGYTWYPKDWGNSENVFELSLSERGLYRELIDLAMLNDNKTEIKIDVWCRKFAVSFDEINHIIDRLLVLGLVCINDNILFIPSCESRLNLSRGGKKSKPNIETISNLKNQNKEPISEPISEPITELSSEQIESKKKINNKDIVDWDKLLIQFNEITGKKTKVLNSKTKNSIIARLKERYEKKDLLVAIQNCYKDPYHKETNHKYLTLEFISRPDKMEKYSTMKI